jgi:hypothetical protein
MISTPFLLLPLAVLSTAPALCAKRSDVVAHLAERFHEAPLARGLSENGALLEIFATQDGASWTALATYADGTSCLIASGRFWESSPAIELAPKAGI